MLKNQSELWLIWQNPFSRQRYHVGTLVHDASGYYFTYRTQGQRSVQDALMDGYQPHLSFPDLNKVYQAPNLFAAFARRLPDPRRSDFKTILSELGLPGDYTPMDLLNATGGRVATDTYEFVKPVETHFGEFAIEFYVAGWRYYDGDAVVGQLSNGQTVNLKSERDNPRDGNAVVILSLGNRKLGYVPAYYSWFMNEVIRTKSDFSAVVKEFNPNADEKSKLRIEVRGRLRRNAPTFLSQLCAV
ncbi:HIRAN domain-containing protein [Alicyclobacillus hesperidum]|uniref:HIRAN domain-containing protein n=1 Tax=Alicyclobacillus hesperidum TaxID=89784 RepID=UPI002490F09F|nr:HIRAN domain-containing protein [Alicyclobacillus hesperidum]